MSNNLIFNNVFFGEWDTLEKKPKSQEYVGFITCPLELVVAMNALGKLEFEIHETLLGLIVNPLNAKHIKIDKSNRELATKIYDYFKKKYMMRLLKNQHISEYMKALEELSENRTHVNREYLRILVSLPRIYKQNLELDSVFNKYKSVKNSIKLNNSQLHFIKSVQLKMSRTDQVHFFWRTLSDQVVRIICDSNDTSISAWNALSRLGKITVSDENPALGHVMGYQFNVVSPSNKMIIEL